MTNVTRSAPWKGISVLLVLIGGQPVAYRLLMRASSVACRFFTPSLLEEKSAKDLMSSPLPSSLDMLSAILRDLQQTNFSSYMDHDALAPCFVANKSRTDALLLTNTTSRALGLPILNMGMPKCGSTTLFQFFQCAGYRATHQDNTDNICMRDAVASGLPPISTCAPKVQAFLQLDTEVPIGYMGVFHVTTKNGTREQKRFRDTRNRDECFFPQVSLLDEIHKDAPNATFLLNFRPIQDWIRSVENWQDMKRRLTLCNIPGFPRGVGSEAGELAQWWCSHVTHVRKFVEQYPSHVLVELDLYDDEKNSNVMAELFQTDPSCWNHANVSPRKGPR
jgi:hypothetical protein